VKTIRAARVKFPIDTRAGNSKSAFLQGVLIEALNPKTAAFFLAFIPQFIDLAQAVATQFVVLGLISVALNTALDIVVVYAAAGARSGFAKRPAVIQRIREGSGFVMCGLGISLLFARRTS
jgi:threonine/homoserine/homoserine lactone efflux protein